MVRHLAEHDHLPDYSVKFDAKADMVIFLNRGTMYVTPRIEEDKNTPYPVLDPETYSCARIAAPGYDIHWLENEWRDMWADSGMPRLEYPDKAFLGFCKKRYERNPKP
jgi:hypothetical protein